MGRKVTDGNSLDFTAPDATAIDEGEMYRVDGFTHFAITSVSATDDDRLYAGDMDHSLYRCKVPTGTCGTRGLYVKWTTAGVAFQHADTLLLDDTTTRTLNSVARVESVRNSAGYATLRLLQSS